MPELVSSATGLGSRTSEVLWFFIYDSIKILLLIFIMIAVVGFIRTYLPQHKVKKWLGKSRFGIGNIAASMFGALTPFCSCSSIPIFLGFLEAGIPLGISLSFLIASPLINEYLVVLMLAFFGWKITLAYISLGLALSIVAGLVLGRMGLEKHLVKDLISRRAEMQKELKKHNIKTRTMFGVHEALKIVQKIWIWVLAGVGIGAIIHNYIPEQLMHQLISAGGPFTVPIAIILGVPMYGSCAAIVPIAVALFDKGMPIGTALAFMMATSALSLPEAVILRRAMNLKLILIFFSTVAFGILLAGYVINVLAGVLV
ncbi:permease [Candidatus Woesearchaeota archaeon]|nr:permease [Candidatus Woesearchaeota archaeon]